MKERTFVTKQCQNFPEGSSSVYSSQRAGQGAFCQLTSDSYARGVYLKPQFTMPTISGPVGLWATVQHNSDHRVSHGVRVNLLAVSRRIELY